MICRFQQQSDLCEAGRSLGMIYKHKPEYRDGLWFEHQLGHLDQLLGHGLLRLAFAKEKRQAWMYKFVIK